MLRVIIADDHAIVREGLKQIFEDTPDIVVDEACEGTDLLDKVRKKDVDYDVVVLDIAMPGKSGLDILRELKILKPNLQVLILSMYPEEQYALRTLKAGAAGYLTKSSASDELVSAIRKVAAGRKYITPCLAEKLAFDLQGSVERKPHEILSDREYQVLCMLASGKKIIEIADELRLSPKTISTYRQRIMEKTNLRTIADLTRYAMANQLIY